jgi:hypothetical protein
MNRGGLFLQEILVHLKMKKALRVTEGRRYFHPRLCFVHGN